MAHARVRDASSCLASSGGSVWISRRLGRRSDGDNTLCGRRPLQGEGLCRRARPRVWLLTRLLGDLTRTVARSNPRDQPSDPSFLDATLVLVGRSSGLSSSLAAGEGLKRTPRPHRGEKWRLRESLAFVAFGADPTPAPKAIRREATY